MADLPHFETAVLKSYSGGSGPLTLTDLSAWTKVIVRAGTDSATAGQLEVAFGASAAAADVLVCGQRPGEWMLVGASQSAVRAVSDGLDRDGHVSVIDHTHSRSLFCLSGAAAASVLEKLCSLDWSASMTPDGAVVSASVAKVGCDIVRRDADGAPSYLIASDRSFAQYLFDVILDAGSEFDIGVG